MGQAKTFTDLEFEQLLVYVASQPHAARNRAMASRRAGIAHASSHSGRRTFITQLASKGVPVRVLASLAGHRSIATTQRYIDVNDEMKRSAVELI